MWFFTPLPLNSRQFLTIFEENLCSLHFLSHFAAIPQRRSWVFPTAAYRFQYTFKWYLVNTFMAYLKPFTAFQQRWSWIREMSALLSNQCFLTVKRLLVAAFSGQNLWVPSSQPLHSGLAALLEAVLQRCPFHTRGPTTNTQYIKSVEVFKKSTKTFLFKQFFLD